LKIKAGKEEVFENWKNSLKDPYGKEIFAYTERWANLMEKAMDNRGVVFGAAEIADATSHEADTTMVSGNQHNVAKSILRVCWEYGEGL